MTRGVPVDVEDEDVTRSIDRLSLRLNYRPSIREVAADLGLPLATCMDLLRSLEERGIIQMNGPRTLRVVGGAAIRGGDRAP